MGLHPLFRATTCAARSCSETPLWPIRGTSCFARKGGVKHHQWAEPRGANLAARAAALADAGAERTTFGRWSVKDRGQMFRIYATRRGCRLPRASRVAQCWPPSSGGDRRRCNRADKGLMASSSVEPTTPTAASFLDTRARENQQYVDFRCSARRAVAAERLAVSKALKPCPATRLAASPVPTARTCPSK